MLTEDVKTYLRRLHEEAQGEVPGSRSVDPEYRDLAHALLDMFEVLLDPEAERQIIVEQLINDGFPEEAADVSVNDTIYGQYESLRDDIDDVFNGYHWNGGDVEPNFPEGE